VSRQKVSDIIFEDQLGMKFSPVVRSTDKRQQEIQLLQVNWSKRTPQGLVRLWRVSSLKKHVVAHAKQRLFFTAVGAGNEERGLSHSEQTA